MKRNGGIEEKERRMGEGRGSRGGERGNAIRQDGIYHNTIALGIYS